MFSSRASKIFTSSPMQSAYRSMWSRQVSYAASDLKKGMYIKHKDKYWEILLLQHHTAGRGGAIYKAELRQLGSHAKLQDRFNPSARVEVVDVDDKKYQVMYAEGNSVNLIDPNTFEEIELPVSMFPGGSKVIPFLNEEVEIRVQSVDSEPLSVKLPDKAKFDVTEVDAFSSQKDATGTALKNATLSNGHKVGVPAFISVGDKIVVDLKTLKYVSKA